MRKVMFIHLKLNDQPVISLSGLTMDKQDEQNISKPFGSDGNTWDFYCV